MRPLNCLHYNNYSVQACPLIQSKHNVHIFNGLGSGAFKQVVDDRDQDQALGPVRAEPADMAVGGSGYIIGAGDRVHHFGKAVLIKIRIAIPDFFKIEYFVFHGKMGGTHNAAEGIDHMRGE